MAWIEDVGHRGLSEVRKLPGYHDEPLHGVRKGQRSIRLSNHIVPFMLLVHLGKWSFLK